MTKVCGRCGSQNEIDSTKIANLCWGCGIELISTGADLDQDILDGTAEQPDDLFFG